MIGSAGSADLVGEACLLIVGVLGLVENPVVVGAWYVVSLRGEALPQSGRKLQGGRNRLH